ncbi:hypothetical protein PFISCL1PPCAC_29222, partial [Pristionchus fissidentatus]
EDTGVLSCSTFLLSNSDFVTNTTGGSSRSTSMSGCLGAVTSATHSGCTLPFSPSFLSEFFFFPKLAKKRLILSPSFICGSWSLSGGSGPVISVSLSLILTNSLPDLPVVH